MDRLHDELYEALADHRRRRLLFGLLEESPYVDAPISGDPPPDATMIDGADRIEYEHVHLPKLADYGFIERRPDIGCIERGPRFG